MDMSMAIISEIIVAPLAESGLVALNVLGTVSHHFINLVTLT